MTDDEKKKIGQRLATRVETGLHFVELEYLNKHSTPDAAWIRNIYILLSFYTELLLKGIFVMRGSFSNKIELEKKLIKMGHNLSNIGQQLGVNILQEFGIKSIELDNSDYFFETVDGDFHVEDFIDIRYDFIEGKIRPLNGDEHDMFRVQITSMRKINDKLKSLVW